MEYNIKIKQDEFVLDTPRDWYNLGKMICFHGRYNLGDKTELTSEDFESWDELERYLYNRKHAVVVLPLYLYDHSGITMSTTPFSCPWDSGQVGFIYADRQSILDEFKVKRITKKIKEESSKILLQEVKVYDQYLCGDIYSYTITDEDDNLIDDLHGIYGRDECEQLANEYIENLKK